MKNRIVKGKRVGIIILAVAVTVALLFTACAPGITSRKLRTWGG